MKLANRGADWASFVSRVGKEVMGEDDTGAFSTWDYVVLVAMLLISAGIGVYYRFTGGRQKTTQVSNHTATLLKALSPLPGACFIKVIDLLVEWWPFSVDSRV